MKHYLKDKNINPDKLLELYFNGESSLEQEDILRQYFASGNVAPEHKDLAPLFNCLGNEREFVQGDKNIFRKRVFWSSVAAAITIILVAGGVLLNQSTNGADFKLKIDGTVVNDKQLALNIAQDKLDKINSIMGKMSAKTEEVTEKAAVMKKVRVIMEMNKNK